ncbi:hypothetical protein GCM10011497_22400 [Elstera cyanobacteriorum]|uniref:hypothetical protein n=1 Tax=Elstera cyanobacteriorum TaxID=2022747 RepID=UPI00113FE15A|nr:hypothetical protein [Elstera cyanobacteriorum]GFZ91911.1 hypothetical protein GCM10011497_22400 [Elstera cyanobacteriorum]
MTLQEIKIDFSNFKNKEELNIMIRFCLAVQDIRKLHYYFLQEDENRNDLSHKMYLIKITIGHLHEAIYVIKEMISFCQKKPESNINSIITQLEKNDKTILEEFKKINNSFLDSLTHMRNNLIFHYKDDKRYVEDSIKELENSTFLIRWDNDSDYRYISAPDIILSNVISKKIALPKGISHIDQFLEKTNDLYRKFLNVGTEICFQYFEGKYSQTNQDSVHSKAGDS